MRRLLFTALLFSFSLPAFAIYKCAAGDKTAYSDTPCMNGQSLDLGNKSDKNSASDIAKAKEQNEKEKHQVKLLETARHKREATEEKQQQKLAQTVERKRKKCASLAMQMKWGNEDAASTIGKKQESAKRKARRLKEKYELECGK